MKLFKRSVWVLITGFFAILLAIVIVGNEFAHKYSANLNTIFNITPYVKVEGEENTDIDTEYFKSDYYNADGSYNQGAMREHSLEVAEEVASEGAVLLWNNRNALPLAKNSKVSLFGIASVNYLVAGGGSGYVGINSSDTIKSALEEKGMSVNSKLWSTYVRNKGSYGYYVYGNEVKDRVGDINYWEYAVREMPWSMLGNDVVAGYGDAAIMTITRYTSEDGDTDFKPSINGDSHLDDSFLDLSAQEAEVLQKLHELKEGGQIGKIILLINTSNSMQMKNIASMDIDACVWVGMGGSASYKQIANILSGDTVPSGRLIDTYAYDADSAPAVENFGDYTFTAYSGLPADNSMTHNTKYVVYQEGIYVGYKYYETRYEDTVIGGRNADGEKGVTAGSGKWSYTDEVAFPFGYGLSYTTFSYSDFSVSKKGGDYEVSLTVNNDGDRAGREVVQVYLQKPYTSYDEQHNIEKSAVELAGFAKTDVIAPGKTARVTVTVKAEDFKTYDSYGAGTYILEKGNYYLAVGKDAHDALNNILAKKGYSTENGMDRDGNASFVYREVVDEDDFEIYSTSSATGATIKNQFNDADINLYEGTQGQEITYLSRKNWNGTYPSAVSLACTSAKMIADMQYGSTPVVNEGDEMPLYGTVTSEYGPLTLVMLMQLGYDDQNWEDLLNQMTWEEQNLLITYGYLSIAGIPSVAAPGARANDGPAGIKGSVPSGLDSLMCFPSEMLMASTWDVEAVEKVGDAFGMEILHAGYTGIYGPGAGIHRSAYSGRNFEYYSEDGFMSGKMFAAETRGLQSRGVIVFAKHMALNDSERNRYGGTVWANEQSIREIYLRAFEGGVVEGHANGIMTSHNRIGTAWAGKHTGMLAGVLRGEWGFVGMTITDAAVSAHEQDVTAIANAVMAGQDLWMWGGNNGILNQYKDNPTVCLALRDACHRILYTMLHSNAMNGVSENSRIIKITPWWSKALTAAKISVGIVMGLCALMTAAAFVLNVGKVKEKLGGRDTEAIEPLPKEEISGEEVSSAEASRAASAPAAEKGSIVSGIRNLPKIDKLAFSVFACFLASIILSVSLTFGLMMGKSGLPASAGTGGGSNPPPPPPGNTHVCTHKCPVCGGCLDPTCTEEGCDKKCGDDKEKTFVLEAEDERTVIKEGVLGKPFVRQEDGADRAYVGNFSTNVGASLTFNITASADTTATFIVSVNKGMRLSIFTSLIGVFVDGDLLDSRACNVFFEEGGESWTDFIDVYLGCIELTEGEHEIVLEVISDITSFNIDGIKFKSDDTVYWTVPDAPPAPDDSAWARYEFNTVDTETGGYADGFTASGGNINTGAGGYIGGLSGTSAKGITLTFSIESDEETNAGLYLAICSRIESYRFGDEFMLTVNGTEVSSGALMPGGGNNWEDFTFVRIAFIDLIEGENSIVIEIISDNPAWGGNIHSIRLTSGNAQITPHYAFNPDRAIQDLVLNTDNVQKIFPVGGTFNCDNLVVTAVYNYKPLNVVLKAGAYTVETPDMATAGTKQVTIGYEGKTAQYEIEVVAGTVQRTLESLSLDTSAVQKTFEQGDAFNFDGLIVTGHYNMIPTTEVFEKGAYTVQTPDMSTPGIKEVIVSVGSVTAKYEITVQKQDTGWREFEFATVSGGSLADGVSTSGGSISGDHIGNLSSNRGAKVTFLILSDRATEGVLYLNINSRLTAYVFNEAFKLTVNGVEVPSNAAMPSGNEDWTAFSFVKIGHVQLTEGRNVIEFEVISSAVGIGGDVKSIKLTSEVGTLTPYVPEVYDDSSWTANDFNTVKNGEFVPGFSATGGWKYDGYLGNLSGEKGIKLTFTITSDTDAKAGLYLSINSRAVGCRFNDVFKLTVNGVEVECYASMPSGEENWTKFSYVKIGFVNLNAGKNVIVFETISTDGGIGGNVAGIRLTTESAQLTPFTGEESSTATEVAVLPEGRKY